MEQRVEYHQTGPRLGNPFTEDGFLRRQLWRLLGTEQRPEVEEELTRFGDKCAGPYMAMAANAERFKPELEQFDQWGRRVDRLHLSEGWRSFKSESALEGIVAIPYESASPVARVRQAVKLLLFAPSSGMFSCPLAMTDGAAAEARDLLAAHERSPFLAPRAVEELREAFERLTTRDPKRFWTSGQWFTEKKGGSDLSVATETLAVPNASERGTHQLFGYKWFTSAVDAEMTLTLASVSEDRNAPMHGERKPLSLFFLRTRRDPRHVTDAERDEAGGEPLNGIRVARLKDKMATRQLPTAELVLEGADAHLVSRPGEGVKAVTPMLMITRFHNGVSAVAFQLRMRNLAVDFAHSRRAFGQAIADKPLHLQSLLAFDMDARGNLLMVLEMARLLGLVETNTASAAEAATLRVSSSLVKLFTARETTRLMSEGVELFGAVGVMENHMSQIFRDATVLPIWEGTTNTLALDLLRVAAREPEAVRALHESMAADAAGCAPLAQRVEATFAYVAAAAKQLEQFEWNARRLAMNLSRLLVACLAARAAAQAAEGTDKAAADEEALLAEHWVQRCERENESMEDASRLARMRRALLPGVDGRPRDARGKPRSLL